MNNLPLILLGLGAAYALSKTTKKNSFGNLDDNPTRKFPGYTLVDSQILIITDPKKAKEFVFTIGKTKSINDSWKLIFGKKSYWLSDKKYSVPTLSVNTNLVVKDKKQQDNVYFLFSYLYAGAYIQNPQKAGNYADQLNYLVSYFKELSDVDFPLIKSVDEAKLFFENLAAEIK